MGQIPLAGDFGTKMITPSRTLKKLLNDVCGDVLRTDGRIERTCSHGVGHTIGHTRGWLWDWETTHGCDGCCREYILNQQVRSSGDELP